MSNGAQFWLDHVVSNGVHAEIVKTVVETPTYLAIANKLFSEDERADIVALVAADPECGDLIRGTGGFRKVRVARKGLAMHSKSFSLIDCISVGVDRMQRNFEPMWETGGGMA